MFYGNIPFPNGGIHFRMCNLLLQIPFSKSYVRRFPFFKLPRIPPPFALASVATKYSKLDSFIIQVS